jgi:hypothetical protein
MWLEVARWADLSACTATGAQAFERAKRRLGVTVSTQHAATVIQPRAKSCHAKYTTGTTCGNEVDACRVCNVAVHLRLQDPAFLVEM